MKIDVEDKIYDLIMKCGVDQCEWCPYELNGERVVAFIYREKGKRIGGSLLYSNLQNGIRTVIWSIIHSRCKGKTPKERGEQYKTEFLRIFGSKEEYNNLILEIIPS